MLLLSLLAPVIRGPLAGVGSIMQVLVPVQHTLQAVTPDNPHDTDDQHMRGLENRIANLEARNQVLETENEEMSRLRRDHVNIGKLISAQVVAGDSLPWRESRFLDRGTLTGVAQHEMVISNVFSVRAGVKEGVVNGMTVLSSEALVGEIQKVSTYTSQVILQSDPASAALVVNIVGQNGQLKAEFILKGVGNGLMEVKVGYDFIKGNSIAVGDSVVTAHGDSRLPSSVRVGTITAWQQDDDNPALYNATVKAPAEFRDLKRVYVVNTNPDPES